MGIAYYTHSGAHTPCKNLKMPFKLENAYLNAQKIQNKFETLFSKTYVFHETRNRCKKHNIN